MNKFKIISIVTIFVPQIVFAANLTLKSLIVQAISYLNLALELLMAFAVLAFVWYVVKYFIATDKRAEGAKYVMWSLIGFFVILSFWGLINILLATFDVGTASPSWSGVDKLFPK